MCLLERLSILELRCLWLGRQDRHYLPPSGGNPQHGGAMAARERRDSTGHPPMHRRIPWSHPLREPRIGQRRGRPGASLP